MCGPARRLTPRGDTPLPAIDAPALLQSARLQSAVESRAAPKAGKPAKCRAGRRKGSGTRAAEALSFVQGQPGITIPELAAKTGIKQIYLYRVLPGLEQESKVEKQGRGWHPEAA